MAEEAGMSGSSLTFEEKVELLVSLSGVSQREAQLLLKASGEDLERARALVGEFARRFVALRGVVDSRRAGRLYGGFFVLFEGKSGEVLSLEVFTALGERRGLYLDVDWEAFRRSLLELSQRAGGDFVARGNLLKALTSYLTPSVANRIYHQVLEGKLSEAETELASAISDAFREEVSVSVRADLLNRVELGSSSLAPELPSLFAPREEEGEREEGKEVEFRVEGMMISCEPVVDPVSGVPVSDLQIGDPVYVRISDVTPMGSYVAMALKKLGIPPVFRLSAKEELPSGDYLLTFAIAREVFGRGKAKGEMKVKVRRAEVGGRPLVDFLSRWGVFLGLLALSLLMAYLVYQLL